MRAIAIVPDRNIAVHAEHAENIRRKVMTRRPFVEVGADLPSMGVTAALDVV